MDHFAMVEWVSLSLLLLSSLSLFLPFFLSYENKKQKKADVQQHFFSRQTFLCSIRQITNGFSSGSFLAYELPKFKQKNARIYTRISSTACCTMMTSYEVLVVHTTIISYGVSEFFALLKDTRCIFCVCRRRFLGGSSKTLSRT